MGAEIDLADGHPPVPLSAPAARQAPSGAAGIADSLTSREWDQLVDIVVRRMERRMADELARRGRRSTPRVR